MKKSKTHELRGRFLFTILILAIYMVGRNLLLYSVDSAALHLEELDSQNIMISMVSGDRYRYTLFALGIMPYITSNLVIWIYTALRGKEYRARSSPQRMERLTWAFMLLIAASFAVSRAEELVFKKSGLDEQTLKIIAVLEMVVGAAIIFKMANLNKEHGIGAQTPIILVNILDNLISTIQKFTWEDLRRSVVLCLIMGLMVLIMENAIIRVPVQRVSIHNTYADKSCIAFKLDPIGVMPVMFAVSFFMIPQLIVRFLLTLYEKSSTLQQVQERLNLTDSMGAAIYLGIIFTLNMLFSFIMFSPGDMAENLQKGGDSIVGIYAGKKTKRYLRRLLLLLCIFSGCILCLLMGISLGMSLKGEISAELALFPATGTILTGILCPLYREIKTYWRFDSYSFFM